MIALFVLVALAVPGGLMLPPLLREWDTPRRQMEALFSGDPERMREAAEYWLADASPRYGHAGLPHDLPAGHPERAVELFESERRIREVRRRLESAPDEVLHFVASRFDWWEGWPREFPEAHLRHMEYLAERAASEAMAERVFEGLARFGRDGMPEGASGVVERLGDHPMPQVRLAALDWGAYLLGARAEGVAAARLDDVDPAVARRAWLLMAAIDPASGYSGRWQERPAAVAEAMLFAAAWTNPDSAPVLLEQIGASGRGEEVAVVVRLIEGAQLRERVERADDDAAAIVREARDVMGFVSGARNPAAAQR